MDSKSRKTRDRMTRYCKHKFFYASDRYCPVGIKPKRGLSAAAAQYQERTVCVKIICCKPCFEEYKVSLTDAVLADDLSTLTLSRRIVDLFRCTDFTRKIPLPDELDTVVEIPLKD